MCGTATACSVVDATLLLLGFVDVLAGFVGALVSSADESLSLHNFVFLYTTTCGERLIFLRVRAVAIGSVSLLAAASSVSPDGFLKLIFL